MRHKPIPVLSRGIFNILDMRHVCLCGLSCRFQQLSPSQGQVAYVLLTRSPLVVGVEQAPPHVTVRLACVKRSASVQSEPGSNSIV